MASWVGPLWAEGGPSQGHRPFENLHEPDDGFHGGRLAPAVGSDHDDELAVIDPQIDAVEDVHAAIAAVDRVHFEKAHGVLSGTGAAVGFLPPR